VRRAALVSVLLVVVAGVALFGFLRARDDSLPFDRDTWVRSAEALQSPRFPMAKSLVKSGTLRGKSRAEVVSLLGESFPVSDFPGWDAVYYLGANQDAYMPIDPAWLVIRFDGNSNVETYRIISG